MLLDQYYYSKAHAALSCKIYRPKDFDPKSYSLRVNEESFDLYAYGLGGHAKNNPLNLYRSKNMDIRKAAEVIASKLLLVGTPRIRERLPLIPSCFKYLAAVKAIAWYVPYTHTVILELIHAANHISIHMEIPMNEDCIYIAYMYVDSQFKQRDEVLLKELTEIYRMLDLGNILGINEGNMSSWYVTFPYDSAVISLLCASFVDGVELPKMSYQYEGTPTITPFKFIDSDKVAVEITFLDEVGTLLRLDDII